MSSRRTQPAAFTLLELLVATAMTAVLAGSLYATLHVAFKARRSATESVDRARRGELAIELLRAEIESAVVPKGILAGGFLGEDATESTGRASDVLLLHRTADGAQAEEGTGDIRMVELACEPDEDGEGMVLLRRTSVNLLATTGEDPDEEAVCRGVRSFNLRYFDGVDWQDAWDSADYGNALPRALEVTLELLDPGQTDTNKAGRLICRVFRIPCSSLSVGLQVETGPR